MNEFKKFTYTSKQDGLILDGMYMESVEDCKGIVQLVHGMAEYKERYKKFMRFLASIGYCSVIMDLRGHGKSVKTKEDLGYFNDNSGTYVVEDAHDLTLSIKQANKELPIYLFGHSMGALIARSYLKKYDQDIDGLIVCGSPSQNPMAKMALVLVHVMEKFKGDRFRSKMIQNLAFGSYAKRFDDGDSENSWLSANHKNVKDYDLDPKCGYIFTLNGFENLFHLMVEVYDERGWMMKHKDLPILFIAGSEDPCIDTEDKFNSAIQLLKNQGYNEIEQHLFKGMRHEILNEDDVNLVYAYMKEWMAKKFCVK